MSLSNPNISVSDQMIAIQMHLTKHFNVAHSVSLVLKKVFADWHIFMCSDFKEWASGLS